MNDRFIKLLAYITVLLAIPSTFVVCFYEFVLKRQSHTVKQFFQEAKEITIKDLVKELLEEPYDR